MLKVFNKIKKGTDKLSWGYFIFLMVFISRALSLGLNGLFFLIVPGYFKIKNGPVINLNYSYGIFKAIVEGLILAPLIETLIFQYLIIKIIEKFDRLKNDRALKIFISSFLFSLSHYYSIYYIIITFILGIILAYTYLASEGKKIPPFISVFIVHLLYNLTSLIAEFFFNR